MSLADRAAIRPLIGTYVGTGHCVPLVRHLCNLPHSAAWRRGILVRGNNLRAGTPISTFSPAGRYPNRTDGSSHCAIYLAEQANGILVIDQWIGRQPKPVGQRLIRFKGGAGPPVNDADAYYTITLEEPPNASHET